MSKIWGSYHTQKKRLFSFKIEFYLKKSLTGAKVLR